MFKGLLTSPDGNPLAMLVNPNPYSDQMCGACGVVFHSLKRLHARGTCDDEHGGCGKVVEFTGHIKTRKVACDEINDDDELYTYTAIGIPGESNQRGRRPGQMVPTERNSGRTERQCPHCGAWEKWRKIERQCHCGAWGEFESHYASYPVGLVTPLLEAGCPPKVCAECGTPRVRVVKKTKVPDGNRLSYEIDRAKEARIGGSRLQRFNTDTKTIGWQKQCQCSTEATVPGIVCDPFVGVGTTLLAAEKLGRRAVGIDLSFKYCKLAKARTRNAQRPLELMYTTVEEKS